MTAPVTLTYEAQVFAATYPTPGDHPNGGDGSWDQDCGRVMFRFGEWLGWVTPPRGDISSAYRVAMASGPLRLDAHAAPLGAYHFWDIAGPANGHVAQQLEGGQLFMGSAGVWDDWGVDIGTMAPGGYEAYRPRARYLGWATNYAGGRPNLERFQPRPTTTTMKGITTMRQYYARVKADGTDDGEWMLVGADLPPLASDPFQDGYRVTRDKALARRWARQYGPNPATTESVKVTRAEYIEHQALARAHAQEWRSGIRAIIRDALSSSCRAVHSE